MRRLSAILVIVFGLMGWTANAADFNLVAYTGHYNSQYPYGTIEDLEEIPMGHQGWPMFYQYPPPPPAPMYCEPENIEIFLFISTDRTDLGVGGIDFTDPATADESLVPGTRPSGIFSGDWDGPDPWVGIHNRAYWDPPPPPPGQWAPVHDELYANAWNGYSGYDAADDAWYFSPFDHFDQGAVQEDPSTPPGNAYCGNFYKATGLQFTPAAGWVDPMLGSGGQLVPYMHIVINQGAIPCGEETWITIAGLAALTSGARPSDYMWLGHHMVDQGASWVPTGRIVFVEVPEPASVALLALAGSLAIIHRRK